MAGIAVPLITSAISALLPEIPTIVKAVEGLFGSGRGQTKLSTAVDMTTQAANALATAGKIQGIPDATTLTTLIETIVQQMNSAGQLGKSETNTPPNAVGPNPAASVILPMGGNTQTVTISVPGTITVR